jgi:hypothetical protein
MPRRNEAILTCSLIHLKCECDLLGVSYGPVYKHVTDLLLVIFGKKSDFVKHAGETSSRVSASREPEQADAVIWSVLMLRMRKVARWTRSAFLRCSSSIYIHVERVLPDTC